jgi:hypothetical protein
MTMRNGAKGKKITFTQLIRKAAFVAGFNAARSGKPFDYDAYRGDNAAQWSYERGRILGLTFTGAIKNGRDVTLAAVWAAHAAYSDKTMI